MKQTNRYDLDDLIYLMQRLRAPEDGCPWDLEQNYASIAPSTIEEAYEVADAIERNDIPALREELGDLLFQVVFYAQLGSEEQRFDFHDVLSFLVDKLVRRHPHVFPDGTLQSRKASELDSSAEVLTQWESIKSDERLAKGQQSLMDDVPAGFPALLRAQKLQKRAARVGFDWSEPGPVFDKLQEELGELQEAVSANDRDGIEEEVGDLLFTCVNLARHLGVNAESALRAGNRKFESRFRMIEQISDGELATLSSEQLEAHWQRAKLQQSD